MYDVVALGELLIDFTPSGVSENGSGLFEMNPGGAPCNVLAALARLGRKTAFIGKVGHDRFGVFLKGVLENAGIDIKGLKFSEEINTTLAFVHLNENGDRSFSFYRKPGADMMLNEDEVDVELLRNTSIFHFGSVSMTHEPARTATIKAVKAAKEKGAMISYDPNLRPPLWDSLDAARENILKGMEFADILKISEEEMVFLCGTDNLNEGSKELADKYKINLVFITLGPKGCFFRFGSETGSLPAYDVKTIDTTGAGDAFMGGALFKILETRKRLNDMTFDDIQNAVEFANAVGSLATTKKGAIPSMSCIDEVYKCIGRK